MAGFWSHPSPWNSQCTRHNSQHQRRFPVKRGGLTNRAQQPVLGQRPAPWGMCWVPVQCSLGAAWNQTCRSYLAFTCTTVRSTLTELGWKDSHCLSNQTRIAFICEASVHGFHFLKCSCFKDFRNANICSIMIKLIILGTSIEKDYPAGCLFSGITRKTNESTFMRVCSTATTCERGKANGCLWEGLASEGRITNCNVTVFSPITVTKVKRNKTAGEKQRMTTFPLLRIHGQPSTQNRSWVPRVHPPASSHQPKQVGPDGPLTQKDQGDAYSQAFGMRMQESPVSQVAPTLAS